MIKPWLKVGLLGQLLFALLICLVYIFGRIYTIGTFTYPTELLFMVVIPFLIGWNFRVILRFFGIVSKEEYDGT